MEKEYYQVPGVVSGHLSTRIPGWLASDLFEFAIYDIIISRFIVR